ncbi:serine/threonine-protein kinase [Streptomyces sp. NPDC052095]|uniref:serine/threonine-protein kinase n=1 Tax=unclassified Streptomyces TaxID=2593676 RepID=UPI00344B64E9
MPRGYRIGPYEVAEPIGTGGWSTVYAGRLPDRLPGDGADTGGVALKVLPTAGLAPRQARGVADAARREVELGRRVGHPRLVRLLDSLVIADPDLRFLDGAIVLVMERAERSLRDLFRDGVTEADAVRLLTGICEGLAHLHGSGWVHGDLKPENILLTSDGSPKLSDFGLATELTGTAGTHGYAPPMGTLDYLPPERWQAPLGDHGVKVRPSSDIWALGIVVHEMFASGASPFHGATPMARGAAVQEYASGRARLRIDGALPPFWRDLVADCLAPTHTDRAGHTAGTLLGRIAARSPSPRPVRRLRGTRALLVTAAVCAMATTVLSHTVGDVSGTAGEPPGRIRVFNADNNCQNLASRSRQCSLGLAINPLLPYTADNVVPTRVWQGDVLGVDCRLARGIPIIDESDARSTEWYRVRLPVGSDRSSAWLPAVRTVDRPRVPDCPHPEPVR